MTFENMANKAIYAILPWAQWFEGKMYVAKTRKLIAKWDAEASQDLMAYHRMGIHDNH